MTIENPQTCLLHKLRSVAEVNEIIIFAVFRNAGMDFRRKTRECDFCHDDLFSMSRIEDDSRIKQIRAASKSASSQWRLLRLGQLSRMLYCSICLNNNSGIYSGDGLSLGMNREKRKDSGRDMLSIIVPLHQHIHPSDNISNDTVVI